MEIGTAVVRVEPDVDLRAFTDAALLVAAVRLHEAMCHADIEWLKALPMPVQEAFGDLQDAIFKVTRRNG